MSRGSLETDIKRLLARLADTVLGSECGCLLPESMSQELVIYSFTLGLSILGKGGELCILKSPSLFQTQIVLSRASMPLCF